MLNRVAVPQFSQGSERRDENRVAVPEYCCGILSAAEGAAFYRNSVAVRDFCCRIIPAAEGLKPSIARTAEWFHSQFQAYSLMCGLFPRVLGVLPKGKLWDSYAVLFGCKQPSGDINRRVISWTATPSC